MEILSLRAICALVCALFVSQLSFAVDFEQSDKQKHAVMSAGISVASYASLRKSKFNRLTAGLISLAITASVGLIKESSDDQYDGEDMQANLAGAGAGLLIPLYFEF